MILLGILVFFVLFIDVKGTMEIECNGKFFFWFECFFLVWVFCFLFFFTYTNTKFKWFMFLTQRQNQINLKIDETSKATCPSTTKLHFSTLNFNSLHFASFFSTLLFVFYYCFFLYKYNIFTKNAFYLYYFLTTSQTFFCLS